MSLVYGESLLFPSEYLQCADLRGKTVAVTIESIDPRAELRTQAGTKKKPVCRLAGKDKKFVLNKTNAMLIADVYGNDAAQWSGKTIVIMPARDKFGGKVVDCIRVDVEATRARAANSSEGRE